MKLSGTFADSRFKLMVDVKTISMKELGLGILSGEDDTVADLGEIPPDRRETFALAALEANFLYRGTGGATLAVNPGDGHLHLQKYNWLERVDIDWALEMLSRFAETAAAWKSLAADTSAADVHVPPEFKYGGLMQV